MINNKKLLTKVLTYFIVEIKNPLIKSGLYMSNMYRYYWTKISFEMIESLPTITMNADSIYW